MKYSLLALAMVSCFTSISALADYGQSGRYKTPACQPTLNSVVAANRQTTISAVSTNVNYAETDSAGLLDTEDGYIPGFSVTASYMGALFYQCEYLRAEFSQVSGTLGYVGSYIGSGEGYGSVTASSDALLDDFSFRFGEGFEVGRAAMLTPYVELGYHTWERGINEGETYSHGYAGLGIMAQYAPVKSLVFSLNAMVGTTLNPSISIAGDYGFDAELGPSPITNLGLGVDYAILDSIHVSLSVDRTSFEYGQSGAHLTDIGLMYEPDSSTTYTTYKVGFGYAF